MMIRDNFYDIENRLQNLASSGIRPGLARLSKLLALSGHPERMFKAVHIVGTNGKGSTAATLASILNESGYSTALYTSPHLVSFGERLVINGVCASPEKWIKYIEITEKIVLSCDFFRDNRPTYFELITGIAFMIIAEEEIDVAVIEAGLGGRLDATNIIKNVILTIITPIGMDHTEYLGDSLKDIAEEKFAVMRRGVRAVFAGGNTETEDIFFAMALSKGTPARVLNELCSLGTIKTTLNGTNFYLESDKHNSEYHTPLIGVFQADNVALAIIAALELRKYNDGLFSNINNKSLSSGVLNTAWPGRLEVINDNPIILLDGSHNAHAMERIVETLLIVSKAGQINIVLAMMKDKDTTKCISLLKRLNPIIYCTQVPNLERSMSSEELLLLAQASEVRTAGSWTDPIEALNEATLSDKVTICCGSLYLVGYIKANYHVK